MPGPTFLMDAIRFPADKKVHLTRTDRSKRHQMTLCGWLKRGAKERWPAELGVAPGSLCKECRSTAEADARRGGPRPEPPLPRPVSSWERRKQLRKKYPDCPWF